MAQDNRNFYHSFPRVQPGVDHNEVIARGLAILKTIQEIGLVLAPEVITWKQSLESGGYREVKLRQSRICFTELSRQDINTHSEKFGPFSIEIDIQALRRLGALPVIYMPQHAKGDRRLSIVGETVVVQTNDIKYTINQLHQLSQLTDNEYILKNVAKGTATSVHENCVINLQNTDPSNQVIANYQVPLKSVRDLLQFIGYRNAPFDLMIGVLSLLQSLFYPTDNETHDLQMDYYKQREWRLVNGLSVGGEQQCRALSEQEKSALIHSNETFWNKQIADDRGTFRRIDEAFVISSHDGKPVTDLISSVIVPNDAYSEATFIFGDKVVMTQNSI